MRRKELTEQQWNKIAPLLPTQKSRRARPAKDHRTTLNAILWVLRSGALARLARALRPLAESGQPLPPLARERGVWQRVLKELQRQKDRSGKVEWEIHFLDSTSVRAHQRAAGTKGGAKIRP
jgi:transposase